MKGEANMSRGLSEAKPKGNLNTTSVHTSFAINKNGLNFRQVNLSKEEKQIVHELKEKLINSYQKQ